MLGMYVESRERSFCVCFGGRQISQRFLRIAHKPRTEEEIRQLKSENRKLMQEMKSIVAKVEQLERDVSRHTDQIDAVLRVGIALQLEPNEKAVPQLNHLPLGEEKLQSEAITCEK